MKRRLVPIFFMLTCGLAAPALADDPPPFADFTFKRVKVPSPGASKRITVQIGPDDNVAAAPKSTPKESSKPQASGYEWYWSAVSPALEDTGPERLSKALAHLSMGPAGKGVASPRLQSMQKLASRHGTNILKATIGTRVSPALVLAVMGIESGGKVDALSHAGAQGLMQLMPATAERFGVTDRLDVTQNIKGGVAYLDWLLKEFNNDPVLALAGYNAGENAVKTHKGVPPYAETRGYVPKVLAAWGVARGLCITPPELVSDGCVFAVEGLAANE